MNNNAAIGVSGIGLATSLGGYVDACAAFRAGLNRFQNHEHIAVMFPGEEEANPITIAPAAVNLGGYQGVGRTIKLLINAFNDLQRNAGCEIPSESLGILLALPDPLERGFDLEYTEEVSRERRLTDYSDLITKPLFDAVAPQLHNLPMQMIFGERIAFARILEKAKSTLVNQQLQHCLLIVADSLLDEEVLYRLQRDNELKTSDNPVGCIPGEGAAVFWLSGPNSSGVNFTPTIAVDNNETQLDFEEDAEIEAAIHQSWHGDKLVQQLQHVLHSHYENQYFPQVISDINGSDLRATEFGLVQVAIQKFFPKSFWLEEWVPATSFGELGAITGPIALASALASIQRTYSKHREFLLPLSEANGKRAMIHLQF